MKTIATSKLRTTLFRLTLLLALITGFTLQDFAQEVVVTNPASPWTVPAGVTSITVEVWGGGGGGGGKGSGTGVTARGGGGGAYARSVISGILDASYVVVIGTGGSGGPAGDNAGAPGNPSSFGTGPLVQAAGGSGGTASTSGTGGIGGTVANCIGNVTFRGGNAERGGGGGAGSTGQGGDTGDADGGIGTSVGGGNGGTAPSTTGSTGSNPGSTFGGGGSGARRSISGSFAGGAGGAGGAGQVVITYCPLPSITTPPSNQTANIGGSAMFSVTAAGTGLTYQWRKGTDIITNATNATYTISPVAPGDSRTDYNVVITGTCGTITSGNASLTINAQPSATVTGQTNLTCFAVPDGTITVKASGGSGTGYKFSIDNGDPYVCCENPDPDNDPTTYTFTGLSANTPYKVRVIDSVGSESPAIP